MIKQKYRNDLLDYGVYSQIRAKSAQRLQQFKNNKQEDDQNNKVQKQDQKQVKNIKQKQDNHNQHNEQIQQQIQQTVQIERQSKLRKYQQQQKKDDEILYNNQQQIDENKFLQQNDIEIRLDYQALDHIQQIIIKQLDINVQCSFCQNQFQNTIKMNKQNELLFKEQCPNCQYNITIRIENVQSVLQEIKPNMIISTIKEKNTQFNIIKSYFEIYCQCGKKNEYLINSREQDKILCQKCCYEMIAVGLRLI